MAACAIINEGLEPVLYALDLLDQTPAFALYDEIKANEVKVYKFDKVSEFEVFNEGNGVYRLSGDKITKLFKQINFNSEKVLFAFKILRKIGVDQAQEIKVLNMR